LLYVKDQDEKGISFPESATRYYPYKAVQLLNRAGNAVVSLLAEVLGAE